MESEVKNLSMQALDSGFKISYCLKSERQSMGIRSVYDDEYEHSYKEEAFGKGQISQAIKRFEQLAAMIKQSK